MRSYPQSEPNYEGKGMRRLTRSLGDTLEAVMDFHEELSKELGRNISYEFTSYLKARLAENIPVNEVKHDKH